MWGDTFQTTVVPKRGRSRGLMRRRIRRIKASQGKPRGLLLEDLEDRYLLAAVAEELVDWGLEPGRLAGEYSAAAETVSVTDLVETFKSWEFTADGGYGGFATFDTGFMGITTDLTYWGEANVVSASAVYTSPTTGDWNVESVVGAGEWENEFWFIREMRTFLL